MNIAFLLKPKSEIFYLYDDMPLPQALQQMHSHSYTSVPVIDREGRFTGAASEGDFLRAIAQTDGTHLTLAPAAEAEARCVRDILRPDYNPPCHIGESADNMLLRTAGQNYVPVVDDRGVFIGIVTRRAAIQHLMAQLAARKT